MHLSKCNFPVEKIKTLLKISIIYEKYLLYMVFSEFDFLHLLDLIFHVVLFYIKDISKEYYRKKNAK